MTKKLTGKVALVTGGSRGIGAAIAKRLAQDGADVAITYASAQPKADEVVRAIESAGGRALAIRADSADVAALKSAVAATVKAFGRLPRQPRGGLRHRREPEDRWRLRRPISRVTQEAPCKTAPSVAAPLPHTTAASRPTRLTSAPFPRRLKPAATVLLAALSSAAKPCLESPALRGRGNPAPTGLP